MWKMDCVGFPKTDIGKGLDKWVEREIFFPGTESALLNMLRKHLLDADTSVVVGTDVYCNVFNDLEDAADFESEEPVYCDSVDFDDNFGEVKEGSTFDLLSLLSKTCPDFKSNHLVRITDGKTDGTSVVQVDTLKSKYVVLCCVLLPFLADGTDSDLLYSLSLLSHEMSARDDFEMVLVLKLKPQWSHRLDLIAHFVQPFSCLAVPFQHYRRIDSICKAVNMGCFPAGLLVDPNQVVIEDTLDFASVQGMDAFPFTDSHVRSHQNLVYNNSKPSLERLLGHTSVIRYKAASISASHSSDMYEVASVTDLGHKLVGLYLYITGHVLPMLHDVYCQCQAKGLEFEVVVVCIPYHKMVRPIKLDHTMAYILKERKLPWWVLPFNNSVFRRLVVRSQHDISDRLFIVLPHGKLMDPHGELVTRHFGIDAYPFTRETVIKKALDKVRRLTLESSLLGGVLYCGAERISVSDIQGKNVILRLGFVDGIKSINKLLIKNYSHLKAKDPDLEVVFTCYDTHISDLGKEFISLMPWLVYLRDPSKSEFVANDLNLWGIETERLVAFGKDGRICSLNVEYRLRRYGPSAFPFPSDLVKDICDELESEVTEFMCNMVWSDKSSI